MEVEDLKTKLIESPSLNDMDWIRNEILMLYKLSGKSKADRLHNRWLFTLLGTMLVIVQLLSAIFKLIQVYNK